MEILLPGPVKYIERSTPIITKNELDEYFYPLFCRGWEIKRLESGDTDSVREHFDFGNRNSPLNSHTYYHIQGHPSPFLVRKFRFKGNRSARAFLQEIFRIESEEKVRGSVELTQYAIHSD